MFDHLALHNYKYLNSYDDDVQIQTNMFQPN